jgi:hypothetical protein
MHVVRQREPGVMVPGPRGQDRHRDDDDIVVASASPWSSGSGACSSGHSTLPFSTEYAAAKERQQRLSGALPPKTVMHPPSPADGQPGPFEVSNPEHAAFTEAVASSLEDAAIVAAFEEHLDAEAAAAN